MADLHLGPRELARRTGVSTDTLRHYEVKGLLKKAERTRSGYRRYPPDAIARVLLIQRALVIGFSLQDLARVLRERDGGGAPCRGVHALVTERLGALEQRIAELQALRTDLTTLLAEWDTRLSHTAPGDPARLLETLGERATIESARAKRARRRGDPKSR